MRDYGSTKAPRTGRMRRDGNRKEIDSEDDGEGFKRKRLFFLTPNFIAILIFLQVEHLRK